MSIGKGDFIGFTFNGVHSSEFNIILASGGNRFNMDLLPPTQDTTADVTGRPGSYYFGQATKPQQFDLNIAYDNLSELNIRKMRQWLGDGKEHDLIFDEMPYKVYTAKTGSAPKLSFICFDKNGERVYKGEGQIQFQCYFPYARAKYQTLGEYRERNCLASSSGSLIGTGVIPSSYEYFKWEQVQERTLPLLTGVEGCFSGGSYPNTVFQMSYRLDNKIAFFLGSATSRVLQTADEGGQKRHLILEFLRTPTEENPLLVEGTCSDVVTGDLVSFTETLVRSTSLPIGELGLFRRSNRPSSQETGLAVKKYWVKLYGRKEGESEPTLLRYFIPVPQGSTLYSSTSAPSDCFYDMVTKAYFEATEYGDAPLVFEGTGESIKTVEWQESSGLKEHRSVSENNFYDNNTALLYNPGDIKTPLNIPYLYLPANSSAVELSLTYTINGDQKARLVLNLNELKKSGVESCYKIDGEKKLILKYEKIAEEWVLTNEVFNHAIVAGDFINIEPRPAEDTQQLVISALPSVNTFSFLGDEHLQYDYLYY